MFVTSLRHQHLAKGHAQAPSGVSVEAGSPDVSMVTVSKEIVKVLGGWVASRSSEEEEVGEVGERPRSTGSVGGKHEDIEGELREALRRERELRGKLEAAKEGEREARRVQAALEDEIMDMNLMQREAGGGLTARSAYTDNFPPDSDSDSILALEHEVETHFPLHPKP